MAQLIIDTNLLIDLERGLDTPAIADTDELHIAAVSVAEYRVGIEMADTPERAANRSRWLDLALQNITVLDYTRATADHYARLIAHTKRGGVPRGHHDLIIAAHAAETGFAIASRDGKAKFGGLPGVLLA